MKRLLLSNPTPPEVVPAADRAAAHGQAGNQRRHDIMKRQTQRIKELEQEHIKMCGVEIQLRQARMDFQKRAEDAEAQVRGLHLTQESLTFAR